MYANASYKRTQKQAYQAGLWCIGKIKPVFYGEELSGYATFETVERHTREPSIDLDEERAVEATDTIIARLMAV